MTPDIILFDIVAGTEFTFSINSKGTAYRLQVSHYFPFDNTVMNMFKDMTDDEYCLGVGYSTKKHGVSLIDDIQIGISGGVNLFEAYQDAAARELAEETGIDIRTLDSIGEPLNLSTYNKEWMSYTFVANDNTRLVDHIPRCSSLNTSRNHRGVSMMIKGKYNQLSHVYKNIKKSACYDGLRKNSDNIRFVALVGRKFIENSIKSTQFERVPLTLNTVDGKTETSGVFLGYTWENGKVKINNPNEPKRTSNNNNKSKRQKIPILMQVPVC